MHGPTTGPDAGAPPPEGTTTPTQGPTHATTPAAGGDPPARRRPGRPTRAEQTQRALERKRGALSTAVAEDLAELDKGAQGLRVWQWLCQREPKLWPSLCAELPMDQKATLILHLLCNGHAAVTIANKLGLMPNFVKDLWRDYTSRVGDDVMGITLPSLVGRIDARAEALVEMAALDGRPDRAWKIEKERVELLQDLGVVERAAKRYEVAHQHTLKADDSANAETKAEVDRILELERKQRESAERVKRINARVMDSVPDAHTQPRDDE